MSYGYHAASFETANARNCGFGNASFKRAMLSGVAAIALSAACTTIALADDFVISTPVTTTNGGNVVNGNDSLTVTESGAIETTNGVGIDVSSSNNIITNNGTIETNGNVDEGISIGTSNRLNNTGTIKTIGTISSGIRSGNNSNISNSGSVITTGTVSSVIEAAGGNIITNSGILLATGFNSRVIEVTNNGNVITNSGSIVSARGRAIEITGSNTLNLNAPSFLGGLVDLGTTTTLNINSGASHSILWDFSTGTMVGGAPSLSGPVAIFYNSGTQQVATFDPTALTGGANALGDISGNLSTMMLGRLSRAGGADTSSVSAYSRKTSNAAADRIDAAFSDRNKANRGWWVSGFGSHAQYDGSSTTLDYEFDHAGFAIGYDWQPTSDLTFGAMAGYGVGSFDTNSRFANSFDNSSDGIFAAVYGRKLMENDLFVDFSVSGGALSHSNERFVNDNLAALGVSSASADYDSWWVSPELAIGIDLGDVYGNGWHHSPSARIRYANQSVDGYTETGPSAANATVADHTIAMLETRLEFASKRETENGTFTGRIGWQHRTALGDDAVNITMIGQTNSVGFSSDDSDAAYVGFDAVMDLENGSTLTLGSELTHGDNVTVLRGMAKLKLVF